MLPVSETVPGSLRAPIGPVLLRDAVYVSILTWEEPHVDHGEQHRSASNAEVAQTPFSPGHLQHLLEWFKKQR